ncbi:hypothetical protein H9P43_009283 [Blastocladiella emersonii ATCC 22665]|nr:hypothetical protein H9P43_009283 [Blastocladiella emersonii ATCC 22665]
MKQKANASDPAHFKFADLPAELIAAVLHFAEPRSLVPASSRTFSVALAPKFMKHDWLDSILASRVPSAWKTCYVSARGFPGDVGALLEYANGKVVGPDDLRRAGFQYCDPDDERIMASLLPVLANYLLDLAQPAYGSGDDLTQVTATLSNRIDYDLRTNHTRSIRARAEPLLGLMQLIGNLLGSPALQLARDRLPRIFHVKLAIEQWAALVRMVIRYDRLCDPWLQWEVRFGVFLGMHGELRWKRPSLDDLYEPEPGFDLDEDWDYTCLVHRGYVRMLLSDMEINEDNWGSPSGLLAATAAARASRAATEQARDDLAARVQAAASVPGIGPGSLPAGPSGSSATSPWSVSAATAAAAAAAASHPHPHHGASSSSMSAATAAAAAAAASHPHPHHGASSSSMSAAMAVAAAAAPHPHPHHGAPSSSMSAAMAAAAAASHPHYGASSMMATPSSAGFSHGDADEYEYEYEYGGLNPHPQLGGAQYPHLPLGGAQYPHLPLGGAQYPHLPLGGAQYPHSQQQHHHHSQLGGAQYPHSQQQHHHHSPLGNAPHPPLGNAPHPPLVSAPHPQPGGATNLQQLYMSVNVHQQPLDFDPYNLPVNHSRDDDDQLPRTVILNNQQLMALMSNMISSSPSSPTRGMVTPELAAGEFSILPPQQSRDIISTPPLPETATPPPALQHEVGAHSPLAQPQEIAPPSPSSSL